jgi:hypothetical protein
VYEISDPDGHLLRWLSEQESASAREDFRSWIPRLAEDPRGIATARLIRADGVQAFTLRIQMCEAFIDYTIVEEQKKVLILDVVTVSFEDFSD